MSTENHNASFVYWLEAAQDNPRMGGKGRGLTQLASAGLPVPPGFILTADALPCEPESITELPETAARLVFKNFDHPQIAHLIPPPSLGAGNQQQT